MLRTFYIYAIYVIKKCFSIESENQNFLFCFLFIVHVKWGKEKFDNVEVNTAEPPELFQAQLYALSGVPIQRQKIMAKGKTLKVN